MEEKQFTIDKTHLTREYREKLENERRMREYTDNVEKILDSHHSEMRSAEPKNDSDIKKPIDEVAEKTHMKAVNLSQYSDGNRASRAHKKAKTELDKIKKRSKVTYIITNVALSLILVISTVLFVGTSVLGKAILKNNQIDSAENGNFESLLTSANENVTYFLICGVDLSESLTDVIMVACYDLANNKINILQIPRDTYVGSDYKSGKINSVYESARDGESRIKSLIRCINSKFGLPIDHYATVTIQGTEKIIDIAGGVDINLDRPFTLVDDTGSHDVKKYFEAGDNHFDGQWGTAFIRHRASYDAGDTARVRAQRKFYAAFMKKMISLDFGKITSIVTQCADQVSTDLTLGQMLGYAQKFKNLKMTDVSIVTVPGEADEFTPDTGYASYFSVHKSELCKLLNDQFRPYETNALTVDDLDLTELTDTNSSDYDQILSGGTLDDFDTEKISSNSSD